MPRVSKQAKAASHAKIVDKAARLFRQNGIEATGVADIMKSAGLTHGGFYRHFDSKDELAATAIARAFEDIFDQLDNAKTKSNHRSAIIEFINGDLSSQHVSNPGMGCPIVALGAEVARGSVAERTAIAQGIEQVIDRLAEMIGENKDEARHKASGLLSLLVGTVILARLAPSEEMMNDILSSGRQLSERILKD